MKNSKFSKFYSLKNYQNSINSQFHKLLYIVSAQIRKTSNFKNSKNFAFEKFEKFTILKIPKIFDSENSPKFPILYNFENYRISEIINFVK